MVDLELIRKMVKPIEIWFVQQIGRIDGTSLFDLNPFISMRMDELEKGYNMVTGDVEKPGIEGKVWDDFYDKFSARWSSEPLDAVTWRMIYEKVSDRLGMYSFVVHAIQFRIVEDEGEGPIMKVIGIKELVDEDGLTAVGRSVVWYAYLMGMVSEKGLKTLKITKRKFPDLFDRKWQNEER